jgi:hypothetical protein
VNEIITDGSTSVIAGGILGFISQAVQNYRETVRIKLELEERKNKREHEYRMSQLKKIHAPVKEKQNTLPDDQKSDITKPLIAFYSLGLLTYITYKLIPSIHSFKVDQMYDLLLIVMNIVSFIIGKSIGWFFGAKVKRKGI